ncbi:MAG: FAD-binding protein [Steroidobacteraceae bacterium]|nr:FAD-binding protein [Steroidobacteraceae bacterium]MDW8260073.1 FAD-linked oxidase C-terminal domain-containing protein [Gammaproteobacteria bacterium]
MIDAEFIAELRAHYGERCSVHPSVREQHGRGEGYAPPAAPDAVIWPTGKHEVCDILARCDARRVPVIAFGAGTSLEGQVTAPYGGVCLDMARMDSLLAVNVADSDCIVQPGMTRERLNEQLRDTGLFFPIDPGANATLGGMASTRASGTTTLRYGSMWQNVLALEVALADGRLVRVGSRARKSSAGYDLVRLLLGAEGTLGIITELTLRLHPQPAAIAAASCAFPTLDAAIGSVIDLALSGVQPARIEFLDELQMRACNRHSALGLAELPTLFFECHGSQTAVAEEIAVLQAVAAEHRGSDFRAATVPEERARLWRARHMAYFAAFTLRPGARPIVTDICVPLSALADNVVAARRDIDREGLIAPIVGHVGDGNFHVLFLVAPDDADEIAAAQRVGAAMVRRAQATGGTCTGEHGIGIGKQQQLIEEFGTDVVDLMRRIKAAWDPRNILNPGKIFAAGAEPLGQAAVHAGTH